MSEATVVLGFEDQAMQEEVLHFLDRLPRVKVIGAESDGPGLSARVRESKPDAAVVSPPVLGAAPDLDGAALFVVVERETTEALRTALRAGARGFFLWPEERETLGLETARAARPRSGPETASGRVVAVHAARGGAGGTFLATNLAAACAAGGSTTVLLDFDGFYADVTAALGAPAEARTAADLAPVLDELAAEHVERVLWSHPRGFQVLLAPPEPGLAAAVGPEHLARAAQVLRSRFDAVVLHLPRSMDAALPGMEIADEILVVVTLDVLAFRDAKRVLSYLAGLGLDRRCRLVVNRASRADVVPEDCERVFGMRPVSVIRSDRAVERAQNRGELIVARSGQTARRVRALASRVLSKEGS